MIKSSLGISLRNAEIHVYLFLNIPLNLLRYKEHGLKFSAPHACPGNSWIFMCATPTETENLKNTKIHSWRHLLLSWMNRQSLAATYWWFTFIFKSSLSLHFPAKHLIFVYLNIFTVYIYILGMRGIPVLEKYWYILYFKQYDISYAAVAKCTCRWQCFPNYCAPGKCDNRTTQWIKQMKLYKHTQN